MTGYLHKLSSAVVVKIEHPTWAAPALEGTQLKASSAKYVLDAGAQTLTFPPQECVLVDLLDLARAAKVGMAPEQVIRIETTGERGEVAVWELTKENGLRDVTPRK